VTQYNVRGDILKRKTAGKDPRNIKLPDYRNIENAENPETYAEKLDSFWDGESIDEQKDI